MEMTLMLAYSVWCKPVCWWKFFKLSIRIAGPSWTDARGRGTKQMRKLGREKKQILQ
jgi:hypothetical protein